VPTDTIRVIAAVIADGDRLLVCQRPPHKRHGGLWEFPGGKCEPGESDAEAADRELREELGVAATAIGAELFAIHDPGSPFLIAFVPVDISGEPVCHEHSALHWGTLEELIGLPLAPSDRRFVEAMQVRRSDGRVTGASSDGEGTA
jgi:8-oxo-dGTP diphosphatase